MAGRENWCEMAGRKVALHSLWEGGWAGGDGDGVVRERTRYSTLQLQLACSDIIGVGNSGP